MPTRRTRLILYKRISAADDGDALYQLQVELIDRFGLLPEPAKNLFRVAELRLAARALGIRRLEAGTGGCRVVFGPRTGVDPMTVLGLAQAKPREYRFDGSTLRCTAALLTPAERLDYATRLISTLGRPPA